MDIIAPAVAASTGEREKAEKLERVVGELQLLAARLQEMSTMLGLVGPLTKKIREFQQMLGQVVGWAAAGKSKFGAEQVRPAETASNLNLSAGVTLQEEIGE